MGKYSASEKAWYARNAEHKRAQAAKWREENKERTCAQAAAYYVAHREQRNAKSREYYKRNAKAMRAKARAWAHANPEKNRAKVASYNARVRLQFIESVDPKIVWTMHGGCCGICKQFVDATSFEMDHVIPISKGGMHGYVNVQPAHPHCNRSKGNRHYKS